MSTIIFDFDGTIADSFARVVEIAEELLGNDEPVSPKEIERLRGMSAFQVAKELKIPPWKVPFLISRGRRRLRSEMSKIHIFPGIAATVKQLAADEHRLYIMSSNSVQNIRPFLHMYRMDTEFIKIYGGVRIFGKARVLKKLLKQNHIDPAQAYYVGDEVRDIEAAKRAGVRMVSVTWGYNNEASIRLHEPDFLASTATELASILSR